MTFKEFLATNNVILDGGMGTLLQAQGLQPGEYPERWNLSHPEAVREIHRRYYQAGGNVVSTNTFGANALKFSDDELEAIIRAAVEHVRTAAKEAGVAHPTFAALDIGPSGKLLKPLGDLDFEDAVALFSKTIRIGAACGVDAVLIETMNDSYETKAALLAAKESCDLPVLVSNAYGEDGKLMTGASPSAMAAMLEGMGADAIGANCSLGPAQLRGVIEELLSVCSVPVLLKPNAGLPKVEDGRTVFDVTPDAFAAEVASLVKQGVRVVGGCCGTTPAYIAALSKAMADLPTAPLCERELTVVSSYARTVCFNEEPILIGERINPTGKKRFKQALIEADMDYILSEGIAQQDKGVHVLDVNVGIPDIDETAMLTKTVCELQAVTELPLQIDTSDAAAMEAALRRYNGKAMINSVSGKQDSMDAVFPLVKKYGGVVVALTLDESGIPATAEGRVAIAQKILKEAARYGIAKKNIVFDTLAMTISADSGAASATLGALRTIRRELGCHTSLGVSNVSFGLPVRDAVNSTFFAMALENGLSAAIMNPYSADMMKTYHTYRALKGLDPNCEGYIAASAQFAVSAPTQTAVPVGAVGTQGVSDLQQAVIKGLKDKAAQITAACLATEAPLTLVNEEIIPALNTVGEGFEKKTVYLPQLLMSAEAAKAAFEVIKTAMAGEETASARAGAVVIATVYGDIHDIGKNIVRLLLENYGFYVIDLGKDVPVETVVQAVVETHAPLCGLSALMTTTVPAMEETVRRLHEEAPWCKVVVGGAVLTAEYAAKIGADHYAKDAMETVRYAETVIQ